MSDRHLESVKLSSIADLQRQAELAYQNDNHQAAADLFVAVARQLTQRGETLAAAEMYNNAAVALMKHGNHEQALELLQGTPDIFFQAGDLRRQAMALGNLGMALDELGRLEDAVAAYEQSSGLFRQLGEFEQRLYVLQALSKVYFRQGKPLLAVTAMRAGVNLLPHPSPRQRFLRWLLKIPDHILPK